MKYIEAIQDFARHIVECGRADEYVDDAPKLLNLAETISDIHDRSAYEAAHDLKVFIRIYGEETT